MCGASLGGGSAVGEASLRSNGPRRFSESDHGLRPVSMRRRQTIQATTHEMTSKRARRADTWTSDDFVDATLRGIQKRHLGAGKRISLAEAGRLFAGLPSPEGIIDRARLTALERKALKAAVFDQLFEVYGSSMVAAFRMERALKDRTRVAAGARLAAGVKTEEAILMEAANALGAGKEPRAVASVVARKTGLSPQHIRRVLKKANASSG